MLPTLENNVINVFLCSGPSQINEEFNGLYLSCLGSSELKKYQAFHFQKDKNLYLLAHVMVRLVLSHYLNCSPQSLEFVVNAYGKPTLKKPLSEISFNLSHSKNAVALAVCNNDKLDLGIDIECQERNGQILSMATHFFSKSEAALLLEKPEEMQTETFFKLWTLKEAYIKAIGKGLSIDLESFSFSSLKQGIKISHYKSEEQLKRWDFYTSDVFDNYQLSIAARNHFNDAEQPVIKAFEYLPNEYCVDYPFSFVTSLK